jgi:hypothetical protein
MVLDNNSVLKILDEINSDAERGRRKEEIQNAEIYDGKLNEYVTAKLKAMFPKTWESYNVADYNIHKKITDKKAKSYIRPPIRRLDKESETDLYNQILDEGNFNDAMKLLDIYKNRHKYAALGVIRDRVIVNEVAKDHYSFWALAPYEFNVHRDYNGEIYAWSIPTGKSDDYFYWTLWTNESHLKLRTKDYESFEIIPIEGNEGMINPYGVVPFIYVPYDMAGAYPVTSSLPRQAIELNTNLSVYLTSGNMQIGQLVLKYPKSDKIEWITHGLMTAINLPQSEKPDRPSTEASYISPNPNLEGHKDSILTYMMMILDEHGMNANGALKGGERFSSGFERLLSSADVQDIIDSNQDVFVRAENSVYNIIKMMNLRDGAYTFVSEKLKVKFARPKILTSDSEKLENLKKKKELGLWEDWELLLEADPNLTEEEAKKIVDDRAMVKALDAKSIFNGTQVSSLVEVIKEVSIGTIPVPSGIQILVSSFGMSEDQAKKIIVPGVVKSAEEIARDKENERPNFF